MLRLLHPASAGCNIGWQGSLGHCGAHRTGFKVKYHHTQQTISWFFVTLVEDLRKKEVMLQFH